MYCYSWYFFEQISHDRSASNYFAVELDLILGQGMARSDLYSNLQLQMKFYGIKSKIMVPIIFDLLRSLL